MGCSCCTGAVGGLGVEPPDLAKHPGAFRIAGVHLLVAVLYVSATICTNVNTLYIKTCYLFDCQALILYIESSRLAYSRPAVNHKLGVSA